MKCYLCFRDAPHHDPSCPNMPPASQSETAYEIADAMLASSSQPQAEEQNKGCEICGNKFVSTQLLGTAQQWMCASCAGRKAAENVANYFGNNKKEPKPIWCCQACRDLYCDNITSVPVGYVCPSISGPSSMPQPAASNAAGVTNAVEISGIEMRAKFEEWWHEFCSSSKVSVHNLPLWGIAWASWKQCQARILTLETQLADAKLPDVEKVQLVYKIETLETALAEKDTLSKLNLGEIAMRIIDREKVVHSLESKNRELEAACVAHRDCLSDALHTFQMHQGFPVIARKIKTILDIEPSIVGSGMFNQMDRMQKALAAAISACGCSPKERDSGHRIGCYVPEIDEIMSTQNRAGETVAPPIIKPQGMAAGYEAQREENHRLRKELNGIRIANEELNSRLYHALAQRDEANDTNNKYITEVQKLRFDNIQLDTDAAAMRRMLEELLRRAKENHMQNTATDIEHVLAPSAGVKLLSDLNGIKEDYDIIQFKLTNLDTECAVMRMALTSAKSLATTVCYGCQGRSGGHSTLCKAIDKALANDAGKELATKLQNTSQELAAGNTMQSHLRIECAVYRKTLETIKDQIQATCGKGGHSSECIIISEALKNMGEKEGALMLAQYNKQKAAIEQIRELAQPHAVAGESLITEIVKLCDTVAH